MSEQPVTLSEMVTEAKRELAMRRRVYQRMVEDGRMKPHQAERLIAVMQAIVAELQVLQSREVLL